MSLFLLIVLLNMYILMIHILLWSASIIRPNGYSSLCVWESTTRITSPSRSLRFGLFSLTVNLGENSFLQRLQKCVIICCTRYHRFLERQSHLFSGLLDGTVHQAVLRLGGSLRSLPHLQILPRNGGLAVD